MRTTLTTVCGVTCLRANSSPADCASRRPSELRRPKISTTRRVAAAGAAPGSAAGVTTVAAAGPGTPAAGAAVAMARNEVSFWGTPSSSTWTSPSCRSVTSLPFLSRTMRSSATTSAPDTKRGAAAGAWGGGGAWANANDASRKTPETTEPAICFDMLPPEARNRFRRSRYGRDAGSGYASGRRALEPQTLSTLWYRRPGAPGAEETT